MDEKVGGGGHIWDFAWEGERSCKGFKPGEGCREHPEGSLLIIIIDFIIIKYILNAVSDRGIGSFETQSDVGERVLAKVILLPEVPAHPLDIRSELIFFLLSLRDLTTMLHKIMINSDFYLRFPRF